MADVTLEVGIDQQDLRQSVRRTERTLQQMERRLSRRRARNRLRRIREERRTEQRITREREHEERNRQRMERRLSRRRARARLRQIRVRQREERRLQREEERERRRRVERRERIVGGAVSAGKRAVAIGGGALVAGTFDAISASEVLEFQRSLAILAGQADITREAQAKLADTFENVSIMTGKSALDILAGFNMIVEKSGNIELAENVLLSMTKASVGLGAEMEDLGMLAASLGQSFGASGEDVVKYFELLAAQGKKGEVTLENLAQIGADVFSKAAAYGVKGEAGISGVGALLQTTPLASIDERKTAVGNLLQLLGTKGADIKKTFGVQTTDKKGQLRNPADIVKDIIRNTSGNLGKIEKVFKGPALSPFLLSSAQFKETKGFDKIDEFLSLGAKSRGLIEKSFSRVEQTAPVVGLEKFTQFIAALGDKALAPALGALTDTLNEILSNGPLMKDLADGAVALGKGLGFLMKWISKSVAFYVGLTGKVSRLFGDDDPVPPINPMSKTNPANKSKTTNGQATSPQNVKLNVENKVTVDDRGNIKKSKTRVDMQNNSNVGRTLGTVGQ